MSLSNSIGVIKYNSDIKDSNNIIEVFHGSTEIIKAPDPTFHKSEYDYGEGFYLTYNYGDAEYWATINNKGIKDHVVINRYLIDTTDLNIVDFSKINNRLFEFCSVCYYMGNEIIKDKGGKCSKYSLNKKVIKHNIETASRYFEDHYNLIFKEEPDIIIGDRIDSSYMTTVTLILGNKLKVENFEYLYTCKGYAKQLCLKPTAYDRIISSDYKNCYELEDWVMLDSTEDSYLDIALEINTKNTISEVLKGEHYE